MSIKDRLSSAWRKTQTRGGQLSAKTALTGLLITGAVLAAAPPVGIALMAAGAAAMSISAVDDLLAISTGKDLFSRSSSEIGNGIKHAPGKAAHKISATAKKLVGKKPGL